MERKYLTVTALNRYLKYKFDNDNNLQSILLKAEISNYKRHSRGHLYLTFKDDNSQVSAVMFSTNTRSLNFEPKDGDKVVVEGHVSIYEPYGTYQIYIQKMSLDGVGDLYLAYEKLKEELNKQGLFAESHKIAIPKFPKAVGVITSPTGAAVRDVINVISIRFPLTKVIVYPALVQGINAKESIVNQITQANQDGIVDVLIVGRGGGSIEDLWAFNEEVVARAIYDSKIPVISAVGHETDFTIADYVSDLRASTPSHAAELAVPSQNDIIKSLVSIIERFNSGLENSIVSVKKHYNQLILRNVIQNPEKLLESYKLRLLYLEDKLNAYRPAKQVQVYQDKIVDFKTRLVNSINNILENRQKSFINLNEKLELVNPLSIMKKGYTITRQDNIIKKSINDIDIKKPLAIEFHDGKLNCNIIEKEEK